jgi:hypothetical protein
MNRRRGREKGYVYFQDYMPDNQFDTRVTVIGNRAFAFRRMVRSNDFRASGSGAISYDIAHIDMRCIEIAFNISERLRTQSLAFDFVQDTNSTPQLVETSYCYVASAVAACEGYWDRELQWHEESLWPEDAIIQDMLSAVT